MKRLPNIIKELFPSNELLRNPHKGFTTFQRFRGDESYDETLGEKWRREIGWKMERLPDNDAMLQKVGMFRKFGVDGQPDSSIAYFRIPWRSIEPKMGEYDFSLIDKFLARADERGQKVMFRFFPHAARPDEALELPGWIIDELGLPEREIGDKKSPICDFFYDNYAKFIEKIGEHIDGDKRVESVDVSVVSAWGEGAHMHELPFKYKKQMADVYAKSFKNTILNVQFNDSEFIKYISSLKTVGIRFDCLGAVIWSHMAYLYPKTFAEFPDLWKEAPIVFESGWVVCYWFEMGWDVDYIIEQSLRWHITSLNQKSVTIPSEYTEKMENWAKKMGYRFHICHSEYCDKANAGDTLLMKFCVENIGVAPIYYKYPLKIRLVSKDASYEHISDVDITKWLPGCYIINEEFEIPFNAPKGKYKLEIGITDDSTNVLFATKTDRNGAFSIIGEIEVE